MFGQRTNLALLALLAVAFATGFLAFAAGTPTGRWTVVLHGVAGVGVLVLAPWKTAVARRGLRRRRSGKPWSLALAVLIVAAVAAGVAHAAGVRLLPLGVTAMQVHVGAALVAVPIAIWHVIVRPARPRRTDLNRRNAVRSMALLAAATTGWAALDGWWRLSGTLGGARRFTGSHEVGSFQPSAMPVTQWLFDSVPAVDADRWRLTVVGPDGGRRRWALEDLLGFDDRVTVVLDCTGGWYAWQEWAGTRLDRLLPAAGDAASVVVTSVTGYTRRFSVDDLPHLLLATRVAGEPLSAGHGYPARLVAPGRRGFWWVKWVISVELSDEPWWVQPPFPLQ